MHSLTNWEGRTVRNEKANEEEMWRVLGDLQNADQEHPDAWVKHESGWTLSYSCGRRLSFTNVRNKPAAGRHLDGVPPEVVLKLWKKLANGDIAPIEELPWLPGF